MADLRRRAGRGGGKKGKTERSQIHLSGVGPLLVGLSPPKISGPGLSSLQLPFRYFSFSFSFVEIFRTAPITTGIFDFVIPEHEIFHLIIANV